MEGEDKRRVSAVLVSGVFEISTGLKEAALGYLQNRSPQNYLRPLCHVLLGCLVVVDQVWDRGEAVSIQMIHVLLAQVGKANGSSGTSGNRPAADSICLPLCSE